MSIFVNCLKMSLKYPFIDGCKNLPKDKDEDVNQLRNWLQSQPHLPYLTDEHLHLFLHVNNYDFEESKKNLVAYVTFRAESPELFTNRSPLGQQIQSVFDMAYYGVLPKKTPEGYQVTIIRYSDLDPQKFVHFNCVKTMMMMYDVLISENGLCPGYIFVFDTEGMTLSHFFRVSIALARRSTKYLEEGLPLQVKGMCTVNAVAFMDKIFAVFKPFLSEKTLKVIHIFGSDHREFYNVVPQNILPKEYDGPEGTMKSLHDDFVKLVTTKYRRWLEEEIPLTIDESKNPKSSKRSFFSFW